MRSFNNDPAIKEKYIARVKAHQEADQIIKGQYWKKDKNGVFRGCAVGCTIEGNDHLAYETELGIPIILARLEDGIFEDLPHDRAIKWPLEFLEAIPVGADLSNIWPQFAVWLLVDEKYGVIQFTNTDDERKSIQTVADYYKNPKEITSDQWIKARGAVADAAAADADNAATGANYAAIGAYEAALYAAGAAASAAAAASSGEAAIVAYGDARTEWRIAQADKLLQLLRDSIIENTMLTTGDK